MRVPVQNTRQPSPDTLCAIHDRRSINLVIRGAVADEHAVAPHVHLRAAVHDRGPFGRLRASLAGSDAIEAEGVPGGGGAISLEEIGVVG